MLTLTLVTDRKRLSPGRGLADLAAAAARSGVDRFQVREKDLADRPLRTLLAECAQALTGTGSALVVSARPDLALLAGAWGVQLPEEGLPPAEVRHAFPSLALGVSCHSAEGARRAGGSGADWVVLGPVFATPGKEGRVLGLSALEDAARTCGVPVHAVGGIGPGRARSVRDAGAAGILAISAFVEQEVAEAAAAFRKEQE